MSQWTSKCNLGYRALANLEDLLKINGVKYDIPYQGSKILAVFEQNKIPIKFDCRKGTCKSCLIKVTLEGE